MEPKSFASLTSGLLARKGAAKPAMRPQVFNPLAGQDDLGWNDMGYGLSLQPAAPPAEEPVPVAEVVPPAVVVQRAELAAAIADPVAVPPRAPLVRARPGSKAKAAFTLRLDPDRHLRLRLICAVAGRSAQQIVTEALDAFLATRPEVNSIAESLPSTKS